MDLAGIRLSDALVLELALTFRRAHHEATADRLEAAVASLLPVATLTPVIVPPPRGDRGGAAGAPPLRTALLDEPGAELPDRPA